ncbi:MAG: DUF4062 domain-containing protein [Verrucomicrobia bacterium]|jgi:hypothetical protein|nr:DUF4062 domain-containing protein [Verrucomicrobiota bacterium]
MSSESHRKTFRIFLSSTKSLPGRDDIIKDISFSGMLPVCMEAFGHDRDKIAYIKKKIENSDVVVSVFADDPGVMVDDNNTFLMFEYKYAEECGIPVVVFVKRNRNSDQFPLRSQEFHNQEQFIKEIGRDGLYDNFVDSGELRKKINSYVENIENIVDEEAGLIICKTYKKLEKDYYLGKTTHQLNRETF